MNKRNKLLLTAALLVPVFCLAQVTPPAGLTDYVTHNYDLLGTDGRDSGDNTTAWTNNLAGGNADLLMAGYTLINGTPQGTRPQTETTAGFTMLRVSNRDINNAATDVPTGVAVEFGSAQSKGYVSCEFNFINNLPTSFFIELYSGGSVVATLNILQPTPLNASDATITTGDGTVNLANVGFSNYFLANGAPTPHEFTTVEFGWEGGVLDFYFEDNGGAPTTINDATFIGGATTVDEFRVYADAPAVERERMRFDTLNIDLETVPAAVAEPVVDVAVTGADVELTYDSASGVNYQAIRSGGLTVYEIVDGLGSAGDGSAQTLTDTGAAPAVGDKVFYRVVASEGDLLRTPL